MIIAMQAYKKGIFKKEIRRKRSDLVREQYINVCK